MSEEQEKILSSTCMAIDRAEKAAKRERKRAQFGDNLPFERKR